MMLDLIPGGVAVFLDANVLVYHFTSELRYGTACTNFLKRVERGDLAGFITSHVLADVAHRLMTVEAMSRLSWPPNAIASRLRKHHDEIARLTAHVQAVASIPLLRLQVVSVTHSLVESATLVSQRFELLMGDALVVAAMQAQGVSCLASNDADFDRVSGIARYAPG